MELPGLLNELVEVKKRIKKALNADHTAHELSGLDSLGYLKILCHEEDYEASFMGVTVLADGTLQIKLTIEVIEE